MSLETGLRMRLKGRQGVKIRTKLGSRPGLRSEEMARWGWAGGWVNREGGDEM